MRLLATLCLLLGLSQLGCAGWIHAKAVLAQLLIAHAWTRPAPARPWPWADTWPVARLQAPTRDVDLYVLAGATGNALAFGPGHHLESAAPGAPGVVVIAGHRDTHFAFLEHVVVGETLRLIDADGNVRAYRVTGTRVADTRQGPLRAAGEGLLLVTCYPFDALRTGGPLRYLVMATPEVPGDTLAGSGSGSASGTGPVSGRVAAATIRPN